MHELKIETLLDFFGIKDYTIHPDGITVDVHQNVDISGMDLSGIPSNIKFNVVDGNFIFSANDFYDFTGFPEHVKGNFVGGLNPIDSLKGFPKKVDKCVFLRPITGKFTGNDIREICEVGTDVFLNQVYNARDWDLTIKTEIENNETETN